MRYLLDADPEAVKEMLAGRRKHRDLVKTAARIAGLNERNFWSDIGAVIGERFSKLSAAV